MDEDEKRHFISILVKEINIYEERQPNGQWLKRIVFALPIMNQENVRISLDNGNTVEVVVSMSRVDSKK